MALSAVGARQFIARNVSPGMRTYSECESRRDGTLAITLMPDLVHIPLPNHRAIILLTGDITLQDAKAIVNAANEQLAPGGGVCGAIHRAGGPAIWEECKAIVTKRGPLLTGQAVATTAGKMKAHYVIHTVGPVWHGGSSGEPEKLATCYRESIRAADELTLNSIAFPSISTGVFGYPVEMAAPVALEAVADALQASQHVTEARFVLFDTATRRAYEQAAGSALVKRET